MSKDLIRLPKRETSLTMYSDEVCHDTLRLLKCRLFLRNKQSIDSYFRKPKEEANYIMYLGWWLLAGFYYTITLFPKRNATFLKLPFFWVGV